MKPPDSFTPSRRRRLAILLMLVGLIVMFLAPETWAGFLVLSLGAAIEILGMALGHRDMP